jgi:branched-chain amino acid aminotransferase
VSGDNLDFEIRPNPSPVSEAERSALLAKPDFGRIFTDHMVTIRYAEGNGWYDARIEARGPIPLDPATAVLHYGQEIFEGLKAYALVSGGVGLFRPQANAQRFVTSAERMSMAPLPEKLFLGAIKQLIKIDRQWIPTSAEGSLYLRPFQYASEVFLGARPSLEYLFVLIACPVGTYFSGRVKPVTIWVSTDYTGPRRAARARRNAVATMPPGSRRMPRPSSGAATRWSTSTRWSASTSMN